MTMVPDYMEVCEAAVRAGGAIVQQWVDRFEVREKGPADLVTEADLASQEAIREMILDRFADHSVLGEEDRCGKSKAAESGDRRGVQSRWR